MHVTEEDHVTHLLLFCSGLGAGHRWWWGLEQLLLLERSFSICLLGIMNVCTTFNGNAADVEILQCGPNRWTGRQTLPSIKTTPHISFCTQSDGLFAFRSPYRSQQLQGHGTKKSYTLQR